MGIWLCKNLKNLRTSEDVPYSSVLWLRACVPRPHKYGGKRRLRGGVCCKREWTGMTILLTRWSKWAEIQVWLMDSEGFFGPGEDVFKTTYKYHQVCGNIPPITMCLRACLLYSYNLGCPFTCLRYNVSTSLVRPCANWKPTMTTVDVVRCEALIPSSAKIREGPLLMLHVTPGLGDWKVWLRATMPRSSP